MPRRAGRANGLVWSMFFDQFDLSPFLFVLSRFCFGMIFVLLVKKIGSAATFCNLLEIKMLFDIWRINGN